MKIIYHINSLCNPGGMERVTLNKAGWLVERGYEVVVVTTDQKDRPAFYPFPAPVRLIDLGINYSDDTGKNVLAQTLCYLRKRRLHKARLDALLKQERADIVVSLYPGESSFIPGIKDGSRKVLELHQNRYFHRQYANKGIKGIIDRLREAADAIMVRRFDKFVVLTEEDKGYWGNVPNIEAIPNAALARPERQMSDCSAKRVIAVGRLDYQKGFDRLIDAWAEVVRTAGAQDWKLDIFGQGEWREMLQERIDRLGIDGSCRLCGTTSDIRKEYAQSSTIAMSSHYEGFPMVLVEAMACGVPAVTFDFKTGPADIIEDGINGILVKDGDIHALATALVRLINDNDIRRKMGAEASKVVDKYSQERIMSRWESVFVELTGASAKTTPAPHAKKLLQINPVVRRNTSTGKIMREIGALAAENGWESWIAYSRGRDGIPGDLGPNHPLPVGSRLSVALHGALTRLFDAHGRGSVIATKRFIKDVEKLDPDVIHIHNIHGYFLNYRILFDWLSRSGKPVIWTVHDCWLYTGHCYYYTAAGCDRWKNGCGNCPQRREFPKSLFLDRSAQAYRCKDKAFNSLAEDKFTIVPVSEWIRGEMAHSFLKDRRFKVIHNGIDTEVFKPAADSSDVRKKYVTGERHIILGVASIWLKEKGLDDFRKLAEKLSEDEVIVLVGKMDAAAETSLPGNIMHIGRTSDANELAALYSAADAFVNPTRQDNYPTVNLEAIACGTPVVTYRTGGSPEAVTDGTGYVVECGDVDGLLRSVREVEALGKEHFAGRCREYALAHFGKQDRYRDYIELYENIAVR